jgi:uncharacterized protein DUF6526
MPPMQNYANHRRRFVLYHLFVMPVVLAQVGITAVELTRAPSVATAWNLVFAVAVAAGFVAARTMVLTVQTRLIGLEMRLRLAAVLPPELAVRIPEVTLRQLVALRFAGDAELPNLVRRCLAGELRTADEVKRQIREWRADFVRA